MAIIYAKYNRHGKAQNVLDPDTWYGGVVPGPDDVARFYYYQTTNTGNFNGNSTYENLYNYFSSNQYNNADPNLMIDNDFFSYQFRSGSQNSYTATLWSGDYFRDWVGRQSITQSSGQSYPYGADPDNRLLGKGFYYSQGYVNNIGTKASYNKTSDNYYHNVVKDRAAYGYTRYGRYYYRAQARTYYLYNYTATATTDRISGFTFDGHTIHVTGSTVNNGGQFGTASRPFGTSKEEWLAAGNDYTRADKLFDMITGSALAASNGGNWKVYGPHNGRGRQTGNNLNYYNSITLWRVSESLGTSIPGMSSLQNGLTYDDTSMVTYKYNRLPGHQFPPFTEPDNFHADSGSLFYYQESSSSMKYASRSINSAGIDGFHNVDGNHNTYFYSASNNVLYSYPRQFFGQGLGDGNYHVKFLFDDSVYATNLVNFRTDPSYSKWASGSSKSTTHYLNMFPRDNDGGIVVGSIPINHYVWDDQILQKYELTGSQHWTVGRVEMSQYSHFHIKDQAKLTLNDIQSGAYYPGIDFSDYSGNYATLLITDEATLETTGSRSSLASTTEGGIYNARSYTSVIISGSRNFSQSLAPSASSAGDTIIPISNLQNCFGLGDYVTLESTGSLKMTMPSIRVGENFTGSDWQYGIYDSGSKEQLRGRHADTNQTIRNGFPVNPSVGDHWNTQHISNGDYGAISREYTHQVETDEIVQIVSMSNDNATVVKMYGKEGEIQSDMGLFTMDQFAETFGEPSDTIYVGSKRVVLVDSNHLNFKKDDQLVISGSVYKVLHATTYLSQSNFYEFTSSNQPPLDEVFEIETAIYSGSSIWPITNTNAYGITGPTYYYTEAYLPYRMLITGSFQGSEKYQDAYKTNNGYNSSRYGGASGSDNDYRALRLDPTLTYGWRNKTATSYYDYHEVVDYGYFRGRFMLKDTFNWREGEILISGSILRDGNFDPSSSTAAEHASTFGVNWGDTTIHGPHLMEQDTYNGRYAYYDYYYPYPSVCNANIGFLAGPTAFMGVYNNHASLPLSDGRRYNAAIDANKSGSFILNKNYNNPLVDYRYVYSTSRTPMHDDPTFPAGLDFDSLWNQGVVPYRGGASASLSGSAAGYAGTGHIKIDIKDGHGETYIGANGKEILFNKFFNEQGRGKIGITLNNYASIYSINIKTRWQQLILDTTDSLNYRDRIKEGGLLYDHYPNHEVKHIASEVVDPKGFKNLLWAQEYEKGDSDIKPYMFANCYSGTTAGTTNNNGHERVSSNYGPGRALQASPSIPNQVYSVYQNSDNFYIIYDFRTQVEFDTVGMVFFDLTYMGFENDVNNRMNNIRFEVCDDVGVASPAWETVVATYDDERRCANSGQIRFYNFPSGSVNKRFIKYHSRGGTSNAAYAMHSFFGVYNMSGSCHETLTPAPNEDYTDTYGGPSASLCQVELGDTKNFKVGDIVYFWSKQMQASKLENMSNGYYGYHNPASVTGYYNKSTPDEGILGGIWNMHTITAKNGNIITLDKPITHTHIGVGTMCYKYNRGNVTLKGDRTVPFRIYFTSQNNVVRLQNVTFINGFYQCTGNLMYNTQPRSLIDIGMGAYNENYYGYMQDGIMKNVIGIPPQNGGYHNSMGKGRRSFLEFNVFRSYGQTYEGNRYSFGALRIVQNFNVRLNYQSRPPYIYDNRYYGTSQPVTKIYYRNNFVPVNTNNNYVHLGGANQGYMGFTSNVRMFVDNITITPRTKRPDQYYTQGTNRFPINITEENRRFDFDINEFNQWFFPSATNLRNHAGVAVYENDMFRQTQGTQNNLKTSFNVSLMPGRSDKYYRGRDYIVVHNQYSKNLHIVPSRNFETDGYFEFYPQTNTGFSWNHNSYDNIILNCTFIVHNQADVRVDIDLSYLMEAFQNLYGNADYVSYGQSRDYNQPGRSHSYISLLNNDTSDYLEITYIDKMGENIIQNRNIHNLLPGNYSVNLHCEAYMYQMMLQLMKVKSMDLKLVTANLSDITVLSSQWDCLTLLRGQKSAEHYQNNKSGNQTSNVAVNKVLKQSSDLGGTKNYRFNKIKL